MVGSSFDTRLFEKFMFTMDLLEKVGGHMLDAHGAGMKQKAFNDYVTDEDLAVERMLLSAIGERYPDDGFFTEEEGACPGSSGLWIIDPIDGTVDFMNGYPDYCISVCYRENGCDIFSFVHAPARGECFYAIAGCGAYLNGKRIHVGNMESSKGLIIMVPPHRRHEYLDGFWDRMKMLYDVFSDMRSIGSAAMSLCYVASGRANAYYERFLHLYDIAAGLHILKEAGGRFCLEEEDGIYDVSASNVCSFEDLRRITCGC